MAKVMIIDITKCNGCYNCQIACKDEHVGNDWSPIAKAQPDTGQFWHRLEEEVRGQVPKVRVSYMHHACQHCDDAPCIKNCENNAIYKRDDGAVIIDPTKCTGRKNCLDACPYGVIYFNEDIRIAQKCTWCAHLLDKGWKEPRCVDACPTDALHFGEEEDLKDLIAGSETLLPEKQCSPRMYYIGKPKKFIAGAVYDPEADESLEDVTVTLNDAEGKKMASLQTDIFGDFWFEGLEVGSYGLTIEKPGYLPQKMDAISNEKDINVGDIALYRATV